MSLSTNGLTNNGQSTNFQVQYENSLASQANVIANANALMAVLQNGLTVLENEFNVTTGSGWFNIPGGKFGTGNRQVVNLNLADSATSFPGANNSGYGNAINLDAQNLVSNASLAAGRVENVFMAEWSEVLMSIVGNWNAGDSSGEGLSQFSSIQRFPTGHYNYYGSWVDSWLNGVNNGPNPARSDWVNQTFTGSGSVHGDGDSVSFGCALAFIFYLNSQLNFPINQIIAAYSSNLANAYKTLTGDSSDPFPGFLNLIESVYPSGQTATIPGPIIDNPFPIAIVSFWDEKNTFGLDETKDLIKTRGGLAPEAFWVVVDGFSQNSFNALGVTVAAFSGTFFDLPGVTITPDPIGAQFENGVTSTTPQRIRIPFDIKLDNSILKQFPSSGTATYGLSVALNINGTQISGSSASTQFELVAGADPYFSNLGPDKGDEPYLSQDLRVFTGIPAQNQTPIPGGPQLTDSVAGAFTYVQALLAHLNSPANGFTDPNGPDPFNTIFPGQTDSEQSDSSVQPVTLDFSGGIFNPKFDNNYSFAIARVRLQGSSGAAGEAKNVRVFFRLWSTQSNDTDYDINSTYAANVDGAGHPQSPKVGSGNTTFPFYATSDQSDYNPGGANIQLLEIPKNEDSLWWYFGCFLNLYDPNNTINGQQIQSYLNGAHHCLVAQIAYDDAPIPQGVSPLSWDQLAQRNLQITMSDNPGPPSTHRIPQTFDCRPSQAIVAPGGGQPATPPDELMIDWGAIPPGSIASLYWPQVLAADVLQLARQFYSANPLTASGAHTLQITVTGGVSYIPIPTGSGQNFAGLFTVDLPPTVRAGQVYNITVRRISSVTVQRPPIIQTPAQTHTMAVTRERGHTARGHAAVPARPAAAAPAPSGAISWRYVVGTFQIKIPVTTKEQLLPREEVTLAIMKWRLGQISPANRWYPVLQRYISYIAARVDGLGGNSQAIPPSLSGIPPQLPVETGERVYTGRICEVRFDCWGDFVGFVLDDCCESRSFESRARKIGELALRACREELLVSVCVSPRRPERIRSIVIKC